MNCRLLLALYAGAGFFVAAPTAFADGDDSQHSASAMQMMIDESTGKKMEHEDDAGHRSAVVSAGVFDTSGNSNISALIPAVSQQPQYSADGVMSAKIGLEHFKFLVVTQDENGEMVTTHVPATQFDVKALPVPTVQEEK